MDFTEVFKKNPYHDKKNGRFTTKDGGSAATVPPPKSGKTYSVAEVNASLDRILKNKHVTNDVEDEYRHAFAVKGVNVSKEEFAKTWMAATNGKALPEDMLHAITGTAAQVEGGTGGKPYVRLQVSPPPDDGFSPANPNHISIGTGYLKINGVQTVSVDRNYNFATNTVDHTYFALPEGVQGAGIAKALFKNALPTYDKMGMTQITTHANLDAGGYVWGRFGFKASDSYDNRHFMNPGEAATNHENVAKYAMGAAKKLERAFGLLPKPLSPEAKREVDFLRKVVAVGATPGRKGIEKAWQEFPRAYANASTKGIVAHLATSTDRRARRYAAYLSKPGNERKLLTRGLEEGRSIVKGKERNVTVRRHYHWYGELDLTSKKVRAHLDKYTK